VAQRPFFFTEQVPLVRVVQVDRLFVGKIELDYA
jgi:hypothetical protein